LFGFQNISGENAGYGTRPVTKPPDWRLITSPQWLEICAGNKYHTHYAGALEER
jgi:hypothetical protein